MAPDPAKRALDVLFVAHDTAWVVRAAEELMRAGFELTTRRVETEQALGEALQARHPDVVLCRFGTPGVADLAALAVAREHAPDLPFVFVGDADVHTTSVVLEKGATDHVPDAEVTQLGTVVHRALNEIQTRIRCEQAETALREREAQLERMQRLDAIGRLAGALAHDFNNLLTAVLGSCSFLLKSIEHGDPRRADVETIKSAGERGAWLTRHLLIFSRQQVVERTRVSLNAVVQNMRLMLRRLLREDIEIFVRLAPDLGLIDADAGQLEHALLNLVVNAQDAMPAGGSLTIETANVRRQAADGTPPTSWVRLTVRDTGCGMDAQTLNHIFEPFFTTKDAEHGTGLGLSTVYGIVTQFGGIIDADSEVGVGTLFRIYLPRSAADATASPGAANPEGPIALLAEDNDQVRTVARRVLRQEDFVVLEARDGREAMRLCEEHDGAIDLLLSDVVMPGMRGQELMQRIQARQPGVKVLLFSGYGDAPPAAQGTAFLRKPFGVDTLLGRLRDLMPSRSSGGRSCASS